MIQTEIKQYGVLCKCCNEKIPLGNQNTGAGKDITFYTTPLDPVPCRCGGSYIYAASDLIFF